MTNAYDSRVADALIWATRHDYCGGRETLRAYADSCGMDVKTRGLYPDIYDLVPRDPKSPGQLAYEADVDAKPRYHDGSPRKPWDQLGEAEQSTWHKNPAPRGGDVAETSTEEDTPAPTRWRLDVPRRAIIDQNDSVVSTWTGWQDQGERAAAAPELLDALAGLFFLADSYEKELRSLAVNNPDKPGFAREADKWKAACEAAQTARRNAEGR